MATTQIRPPERDARPTLYPHRDPQDVLRRLSAIDLLRALPAEEIQELVPRVELLRIPPGTRFIDEGGVGDALYFIETGTARVERGGAGVVARVSDGSVIGEAALLTGAPRNASVYAETELWVWRIAKAPFDELVARSPNLRRALEDVAARRAQGEPAAALPSRQFWVATALHALEARSRGVRPWQALMALGLLLWLALFANGRGFVAGMPTPAVTILHLVSGLLLLQGACEAFLLGVERFGARRRWDGFIAGTVGSLLSTLPEFVVIAFLVRVEPLAAFVTAVVAIFNNALIFSLYSFFLPKDRSGAFAMPRSLTVAGGEILIAGGAIALIVGLVMMILHAGGEVTVLDRFDLIGIATILIVTFGYYLYTLMQYYGEGLDDRESVPPDPRPLGYDPHLRGILWMFALGVLGAYCGGEAIGGFAESALSGLGWPTIPTAAMLAFFAGISEIIIVYKSHRRGELGVALSNAFGGMTQVMFLLMPFALLMIGILGIAGGGAAYTIPINVTTMLLMVLLFPVFYALHQYMEQEKQLTNLDAVGMTGIYVLLLYFLFTSPS
ncbi:MAG TPA: cyclic nucleotide-binding domain-containing protein [Longimicrobiales bacterium]|nr:cyclic nucleotide-binding domain-containing protein [Longimicrobiales bacterium]